MISCCLPPAACGWRLRRCCRHFSGAPGKSHGGIRPGGVVAPADREWRAATAVRLGQRGAPARLADLGIAGAVQIFARNRLCVTVRNVPALTERPLPQVLFDPHWRLATSTPEADPSGDYALQLFERCEQYWPGQGVAPPGAAVGWRQDSARCRRADWQRNI